MSSNTIASASYLSAGIFFYEAVNGNWPTALSVPVVGIGLKALGNLSESETVTNIGNSILASSALIIPGSLVGYAINTLGGNTLTSQISGCAVGIIVGGVAAVSIIEYLVNDAIDDIYADSLEG